MSKSNYDHLKDLLKGTVIEDEALEFLEAMQEGYTDEIKELKKELDDLKAEEHDMDGYDAIDLGLNTMYIKLEKGNLRIQSQLEAWVNQVKKQNCAGMEMAGSLF